MFVKISKASDNVTEIRFYHLLRDTTNKAVPDILNKALSRGMRVLLKLPNEDRRNYYDDWLWRYHAESFLPHAQDGDLHPESQPVWLSTQDAAPNDARMAFVIEGSSLPSLDKFDLICLMFDSENADRLQQARQLWAELKQKDGLTLTYWKQGDDGRWVQQKNT